mgnify:CR=1 FL=1
MNTTFTMMPRIRAQAMAVMVTLPMAIAIPPIPGGAITGFAFLFSQMGIPTELAGLAIAMDTIIDRYSTASNVTTLKLELLRQADRQKLLNRKKLEKTLFKAEY